MLAHKALKAVILLFILISGSFFQVFLTPVAGAEGTQGYTTLYFTNVLNINSEGDVPVLTPTPPTSQQDSFYPPHILTDKELRDKNNTMISEEFITWLSTALLGELFGNLSDMNLSDIGGLEGFELFFPGLNRISEEYVYTGNDTLNIHGDILYHLYFSDTRKIKKLTDSVDVSLYAIRNNSIIPLPRLIKNTTVLLEPPKYLGGVYDQQILLPNVNYTLVAGDTILFSIKLLPTNKSMLVLNLLNSPSIKKTVQWMVNRWENNITHGKIRRQLGALIKEVTTLLEATGNESGMNFSTDDIASFLNTMKSTRLIYDSQAHPSSVTIPAKLSEEDIRTYYFSPDQILSQTQQGGTNSSKTKILTTPTLWTMEEALERNSSQEKSVSP